MLRFLRKIRKGFKRACLTAAVVTCWQIGQTAQAYTDWPPDWGEEVTFKISGTVSPTVSNISHLFLIYGTGTSGGIYFPLSAINLGSFEANRTTSFSISEDAKYGDFMWWYAIGLYGDSGQYSPGTNGVTLGIWAQGGEPWDSVFPMAESTVFTHLLNDAPENLPEWQDQTPEWRPDSSRGWHIDEPFYEVFSTSSDLFNFSQAANNGQLNFSLEVVPEPVSIVLLGTGGMIVVALRRRNQ